MWPEKKQTLAIVEEAPSARLLCMQNQQLGGASNVPFGSSLSLAELIQAENKQGDMSQRSADLILPSGALPC